MLTVFPIRSNANGLVAGGPAQAVARRLKTAALLGDVLVQDGIYEVTAGPDGGMAWLSPATVDQFPRFQTAAERGARQSEGFTVAIGAESSDLYQPRVVVASATTINWRASFLPFKEDLGHGYPWIEFDGIELNSDGKKLVSRLLSADQRTSVLAAETSFVRRRLLEHVNADLVTSMLLEAAVSMDGRHLAAIAARVAAGQAEAVVAADSVAVLVPNVAALSWADIDELRKTDGWADLRALWTDIGAIAADEATSSGDIARIIHDEYEHRLREAAEVAEGPRGGGRWAGTSIGLSLGAIPTTAGWPMTPSLLAGAAATAVGVAADALVRRAWRPPRWRVADSALADAQRRAILREDA